MENRPYGREKHITGTGKQIQKKGSGMHSGPVGRTDGMPQFTSHTGGERSSGQTRASGRKGMLIKVIIAAVILLGGGSGLAGFFGSGNQSSSSGSHTQQEQQADFSDIFDISSLLSGGSITNVSSSWVTPANTGKLNTSVDPSARSKRTAILGNGSDKVTIMMYLCGTDLESKSGMASSDLQEILNASTGENVNILVYTGGCTKWQNNIISNKYNQIYQVKNGKLYCLVNNDGTGSMIEPETLTGFIKYCTKNFPANRNELILWDHGGGSLSGYGYDEKNPRSGSMTLKGIDQALSAAGTTFDFIGFDACLMATLENALTVSPYADYLIASEETEPGVGWYYTNWLKALDNDTSMPTIEIGRNIADDFVSVCSQKCSGQKTTLSVVDLAELEQTVPEKFREFASGTADLLQDNEYKTVSDARSNAREFASSNKLDQVDLVHLAYNMETDEGQALAESILSAVKYNKTSGNMTNAYGLSVYFPYRKTSQVDNAVKTYDAIGIDSEYTRCIQQFASMETAGQAVSGSNGSPFSTLMGETGSPIGLDMISSVLTGMLSNSTSGFLGKSLDVDQAVDFISENQFDCSALIWENAGGTYRMALSEEQWGLVQDLELNVFFDDGEGYIDLGCDNVYELTDEGALLGEYDGTWLAIDDQPVAYYYMDTVLDGDAYTITGRVPVLVNGARADLIIVFDNDNPYGYIAGVRADYRDGETETVAKAMTELSVGDEIIFLCDYYSYDGEYLDSYYLSEPWIYTGDEVTISNVYIDGSAASAFYKFTDIYCQQYWTAQIPGGDR